ncbi:MAG: hypothetical protein HY809_02105 [Nitrospirae bacterium]|nr:hypothetical protein [Nitrospirota bacterium]
MDEKYIGSIATIGGVLIGFILSTISTWIKAGREASRLEKSTKRLLELEIVKNRAAILDYWKVIVHSSEKWYHEPEVFNYVQLGRAISKTPFPVTSKNVFIAFIDRIPLAYSDGQIYDLWETYEKIDQLMILYDRIGQLQDESQDIFPNHDITSHWSERVPQDTFGGSIVMRSANRFGGMLLSFSGTRRSILRWLLMRYDDSKLLVPLPHVTC